MLSLPVVLCTVRSAVAEVLHVLTLISDSNLVSNDTVCLLCRNHYCEQWHILQLCAIPCWNIPALVGHVVQLHADCHTLIVSFLHTVLHTHVAQPDANYCIRIFGSVPVVRAHVIQLHADCHTA